jgi:hypothetical protein
MSDPLCCTAARVALLIQPQSADPDSGFPILFGALTQLKYISLLSLPTWLNETGYDRAGQPGFTTNNRKT